MYVITYVFFTLVSLISTITAQNTSGNLNIQSLLNQLCSADPTCKTRFFDKPDESPKITSVSPKITTVSPVTTPCFKRCPQTTLCLPANTDCSLLNSNIQCEIPKGLGVNVQSLICGTGEVTSTCSSNSYFPVLTEIIVQCQDTNEVDSMRKGVQGMGILEQNGSGEGAGVYRCSTNRQWTPIIPGSPPLSALVASCYYSGCGKLPLPTAKLTIDRSWSWVRGLNNVNNHWCTVTLISPTTAVTAAHCVAQTNSNHLFPNWHNDFDLKLPAQSTKLCNIIIHPGYIPGRRPSFDIALLKFTKSLAIPYACVAAKKRSTETGILFELIRKKGEWKTASAKIDPNCVSSKLQNLPPHCDSQLRHVPFGQFCLTEHLLSPPPGSSGGPFLVPLHRKVDDIWGVAGVLSYSTNDTECLPEHYIYTDVTEPTIYKWIMKNMLDDTC